jgi:uncharacterized protein YciI
MAYFVFQGIDKPNSGVLRQSLREAHRVHIRADAPDCRTILGGPLLTEGEGAMFATLLVFEAPDRDTVRRFMENDPYSQAGLFETVTIDRWQWGLGNP